MSDEYNQTIVPLPGTRLSPEVVLHRALAKLAKIKAVTLVIQWEDDTFDTEWSQQQTSMLCSAATILMSEATDLLRDRRRRPDLLF